MTDLARINPCLELERRQNRATQNTLSAIFRGLDVSAEQLESALLRGWVEAFEGRFVPDYLRVWV